MICLECHSQVRKAVPVKLKGGRVGTVCLRCYGLPANTKAIPARNPFWADAGMNLGIGLGLGAGWLLGGELVKRGMKFLGAKESNPLYEDFHGAKPKTRSVEVPMPDPRYPISAMGRAVEDVYAPYGSSTLKGKSFKHEWGDKGEGKKSPNKPILAVQEQTGWIGYVPDKSKAKPTERGIVG